ncbi:MAG: hypothetical protein KR126chlam2_00306 [Chlamydiae bacterium]|nr:hypothetical protein [Chlamydiota bacterium]
MLRTLFIITFFAALIDCHASLVDDLVVAHHWDAKLEERLPITYNHLLSTGCFTTPSARMAEGGEIGIGGAHAPPYLMWNARIQPFSHVEFSVNYRIFKEIRDEGLSPFGFGDFAARAANFKWALFTPEDSENILPGVAIGVEDFMGTKKFTNYFAVATQIWMKLGLETSLGWGAGRYTGGPSRGVFGSASWFPWWNCCNKWTKGFALAAEYDPIDYSNPEREPHPDGRTSHLPINYGVKYNLCDLLHFSASRIRGDDFAYAGSLQYNWGKCEGLIPKVDDPPPYTAPVDREPLGCARPESVMVQQLNYALSEQGLRLTKAWIKGQRLWISLINQCYRQEHVVRERVQHLLATLTPSNIAEVIVIVESYGLPCQQYVYSRELLLQLSSHRISPYEFDILTPRREAAQPCGRMIFHRRLDPWKCQISPRLESFFGSASGKYKYDFGVKANVEGFAPGNLFYEVQFSYSLFADIQNIGDFDKYNPSQLPNVLTDYVRYRQAGTFSTDIAYLQRSQNFGRGIFGRAAAGYFQVNYAGVAGELLWYPTCSYFALGIEGAVLKKRRYTGLGFQSELRRLDGFTETFHPYSTLQQFFLTAYCDIPEISVAAKASIGQFLAYDRGARFEMTRYFTSGLNITAWITITDAYDVMHGAVYFNKGISIELPLDLFFKCSSRRVWNYALAAWLRDAGAFITTGKPLFETINRERRW